ncbi:deoxyribodipyrimidine photo-lyase, partial [Streptomyces sp. SID10244]|nr:deoxyribodipyrimidine photo-lyase [Streptomyces sp. SID10244]
PRTMAADLGRSKGAQAYLRELGFRDFYASVLYHWPDSLWHNWNREFDDIRLDTDQDAYRRFDAWKQGRTGFPIVDAG